MSNPRINTNNTVAISQLRTFGNRLIAEMQEKDANQLAEFEQRGNFIIEELSKRINEGTESNRARANAVLTDFDKKFSEAKMQFAHNFESDSDFEQEIEVSSDFKVEEQDKEINTNYSVDEKKMQDQQIARNYIMKEMRDKESTYLNNIQILAGKFEEMKASRSGKNNQESFKFLENYMDNIIDLSHRTNEQREKLLDPQNKLDIGSIEKLLYDDNYWETINHSSIYFDTFQSKVERGQGEKYHRDLSSKFLFEDTSKTISDYAINPTQKGIGWAGLLESLLKNTPENHPFYQRIADLKDHVNKKNHDINENKRIYDDNLKQILLDQIKNELNGLASKSENQSKKQLLNEIVNNITPSSGVEIDTDKMAEDGKTFLIKVQNELNRLRLEERNLSQKPFSSTSKTLENIDKIIKNSDLHESISKQKQGEVRVAQKQDLIKKKQEIVQAKQAQKQVKKDDVAPKRPGQK